MQIKSTFENFVEGKKDNNNTKNSNIISNLKTETKEKEKMTDFIKFEEDNKINDNFIRIQDKKYTENSSEFSNKNKSSPSFEILQNNNFSEKNEVNFNNLCPLQIDNINDDNFFNFPFYNNNNYNNKINENKIDKCEEKNNINGDKQSNLYNNNDQKMETGQNNSEPENNLVKPHCPFFSSEKPDYNYKKKVKYKNNFKVKYGDWICPKCNYQI